ncbi:hypothetical protein M409DRAFT_67708 [Zasmidium cellare ATCC 36951]|uniref:NAD(P)-binding domain-containing protein n=1 Tax=Zasmidium cellare ATCC 36951 TaxID=1080233 RepID=A0A6A6CFW7_ZASCE|nr:uncharacterized protein M409DRAFT_67708 [Zasmidium cellare ATCC 36951]KAF2164559.1 hypothetical protein M409DRAFT_67708 [Zasmidium cellare ATCC 36951]
MATSHPIKIFATGLTGYIGGDALYALNQTHPEYEITALVRNTDKGAKIAQQYPKVKLVYGDLDSEDVLEAEAGKADVVCHFAHADHEPSIQAIVRGLSAKASKNKPRFLIHTSGTGILLFEDLRARTFGEAFREKVYDDLEGVKEVTSLPDDAIHRNVDKIVLEAGTQHADRIKTAIVCPPTIYGIGRGPDNQRSMQLPQLCASTIELGYAPRVNAGKTYWGNVHVQDLSDLYVKLIEQAAAGGATADWSGKPPIWGAEGYYFCENGEHVWGEVSQWVADEAKKQGLIETDEVRSLSTEEVAKISPYGPGLWGANSRARAKRARKILGWEAKGRSLRDEVKGTLEFEARKLGKTKGHAAVAAGET